MKKTLLVMLAICAVQAFADSSESMTPSIWTRPENQGSGSTAIITPFIGVADMNVKTSGGNGLNSDTGLSVGALAEFGRGYVTFQTGALYNEFGAKASGDLGTVTLTLSYINVPLLAKFNFMGNAEQTVYAKVGLMPGILTSSNIKASDGSSASEKDVESFDLPAVIGIGGALPITGTGSLIIEANFVRSLTSIASGDDSKVYNQGFIIGAGFSIPL